MQGAERPAGLGRDFVFVSLGTFLQVFGFFLYLPILPLMVVGPLMGSIVPRVVGGRWYDRHGPLRPGLAGLLCLLAGWVLLGFMQVPIGALAGAALVGMGFGTLMPVYAAMTMDLVPANRRGAANATTFLAFDIGTGLGSLVAGALVDEAHLPWIFLVAASLALGSMTFFYLRVLPDFRKNRV